MTAPASGQLRALVALRWRMVRSSRARLGFVALAATAVMAAVAAVYLGLVAPGAYRFEAALLAPTAFLAFLVLALIASLVAGGGYELFPDDQLAAYPVSARTQYVTTLLLAPLNLAWLVQVTGLLGLMAYVGGPRPGTALTIAGTCLYVVLVTVLSQGLAWLIVGVRQRRWGRRLSWAAAAMFAGCLATLLVTGQLAAVLDRSPLTWFVTTLAAATDDLRSWVLAVASMLVVLFLAVLLGRHACTWALRRSGDHGSVSDNGSVGDGHVVRRRPQQRTPLWEMVSVDRASIWRSVSLRRGLLVLGLMPGLIAAAAQLDWPTLVLLPALVSAGAGLLFGVNVFCLDASGALWLASLPGRARDAFVAKAIVVFEVCAIGVALTLVSGAARTEREPTPAELAAVCACGVVAIAQVVARCMTLSVDHPHRADLRGSRDTPAPPGVMVVYSARLALGTTLIAILFSLLARSDDWRIPTLFAVPFLLLALRRLVAASRRWADPAIRAQIVTTVASG